MIFFETVLQLDKDRDSFNLNAQHLDLTAMACGANEQEREMFDHVANEEHCSMMTFLQNFCIKFNTKMMTILK